METQTTTTPRFRTDLVTQPIETEGQRFVDVTDPDSGTTFRFYEVEYAIACAMNGNRDLSGLASWALEELGLETSSDELATVISTLGELGYLETETGAGDMTLGAPGGKPPVEAVAAPIEAGDFDLGAPGKSPIARVRPQAPAADDIALGAPGAAAPAASAGAGASEESFEGLLDEEPPTTVRPAPKRTAAASMDDEPTRRREVVDEMDFGDLEGITPPPAEVPSPKLRPITSAPMADDDGPTNLPPPAPGLEEVAELAGPDVSVDLSEHLSIDAADVKEAVRQSQVMQAVDVPEELLAEIGEETAKPAPTAAADSSVPVVLPGERAQVSRPVAAAAAEPEAEPAPVAAKGGSGTLLFLLFLLIVVGAGAAYYFLIYKKKQENQGTTAGTTQPAPPQTPVAPTPPPAPPKPKATLEAAAGEPTAVVMPKAGAVSWMADDGAQVAKGDPVAKLKGIERYQRKFDEYVSRQEHYQRKLDKANEEMAAATTPAAKASAQRHIDAATRKVEQKKQGQADMTTKMAMLTLTAPVAGTVEQVAHEGGWIKEGAPVVQISGPAEVQATFTLPAGRTVAPGDTVKVTSESPGAQGVDCQVAAVDGSSATVRCPASDALTAGSQVILQ